MQLNRIFPDVNFNEEMKYFFVGKHELSLLNKYVTLKEQFFVKFPYYTIGNIFDNFIFFPNKQDAINFVYEQPQWWSRRQTKYVKVFNIINDSAFIISYSRKYN